MNDERLSAELQRRAQSVNLPADWSARVLQPAVSSDIASTPARVPASRAPAFAGLAVMAGLVLVLVMALPWLPPGPAVSSPQSLSSTASAGPTATVPLRALDVMDEVQFAAGLADDLLGVTVIVEGRIVERVRQSDEVEPCTGGTARRCTLGQLGAAPGVIVNVQPTNVGIERGQARIVVPQLPVEGLLILSVDRFGTVDYLGTARPTGQGDFRWAASAVATLDILSVPIDQALVVDGWLTPEDVAFACPAVPDRSEIDGLPSMNCRNFAWLSASRVTSDEVGSAPPSADGFAVAGNWRFLVWGDAPMSPVYGRFVVVRRLYGGGCAGPPPCWYWEIARVMAITERQPHPSSIPTPAVPSPMPTPEASHPVATPGVADPDIDCAGETGINVRDETGLVVRCDASRREASDPEPLIVGNPDGDYSILELTWTDACRNFQFTLRRTSTSAFELVAFDPMPVNVVCDGLVVQTEVRLYLAEPIDRQLVAVTMTRAPATTPEPRQSRYDCDRSPADFTNGAARIEDHTGLVLGCEAAAIAYDDVSGASSSTDPPSITMSWAVPCGADPWRTQLQLWPQSSGDEDHHAGRRPYVLVVNRLEPLGDGGCFPVMTGRQLRVDLAAPLEWADIEQVWMQDGRATATEQTDIGDFELILDTRITEYGVDEPVDVVAALAYSGAQGAVPVSGMSVDFQVEQIDGSLSLASGPTTQMCGNGELRVDEPLTLALGGNLVTKPFTGIESYYDPDPFVLPPGAYVIHVGVTFALGEGCSGDSVLLDASIAIFVE